MKGPWSYWGKDWFITFDLSSSASSFWILSLGLGFPALRQAPWTTDLNKHLPSPGIPETRLFFQTLWKKIFLKVNHHSKVTFWSISWSKIREIKKHNVLCESEYLLENVMFICMTMKRSKSLHKPRKMIAKSK